MASGVYFTVHSPLSTPHCLLVGHHLSYGARKKVELTLRQGCLSGVVHTETKDDNNGYQADVLGFIETKDGKVTRFDVVAKGPYWWRGKNKNPYGGNEPYFWDYGTSLVVVPHDRKVTLAVTFTLADPNDDLAKVPPAAVGDFGAYLR